MSYLDRLIQAPPYLSSLQALLITLRESQIYSENEIRQLADYYGVELPDKIKTVRIMNREVTTPLVVIAHPSEFSTVSTMIDAKSVVYDRKYYDITIVPIYNFLNDLANGRVPFRRFTVYIYPGLYQTYNVIGLLKNVKDTAVCYDITFTSRYSIPIELVGPELNDWKKKFILTQMEMCNDLRLQGLYERYKNYDEKNYWKYPTIKVNNSDRIDNDKAFRLAMKYNCPVEAIRKIYNYRHSKRLMDIAMGYGITKDALDNILKEFS